MLTFFVGKVADMPSKYNEQTRSKPVRLVQDHQGDYASEWEAIKTVSGRAVGDERGDAVKVAASGPYRSPRATTLRSMASPARQEAPAVQAVF